VLSDSKLSLSPTSVWTDVRALEMFVRELESGGERTAGQADALAHELLSRYRGEFLAHEGVQPWLIQPRDRLRRDFQRSLLALGAILQRETSWNTALELYRAGIERDPIAEAFYQESMRCLGQLGLAAEVGAHLPHPPRRAGAGPWEWHPPPGLRPCWLSWPGSGSTEPTDRSMAPRAEPLARRSEVYPDHQKP
jgi:hypothetical protein